MGKNTEIEHKSLIMRPVYQSINEWWIEGICKGLFVISTKEKKRNGKERRLSKRKESKRGKIKE